MAEYDRDLQSIQAARRLAVACREAQRAFAASSQEQVDRVCAAMAEAGFAAAERLGRLAAAETGFGVAEHKRFKDEFATKVLWESIKDTPTVGVINRDDARRVVEIGWPLGVVVGLTPSTNPTSTAMYKILIAVKARNGIIISCHPSAARCTREAVAVMADAAERAGAPPGLIAALDPVTLEGTNELMRHWAVALILATGGTPMVRAAHSAGKPAYGVGPGNVPVYVDRTADLDRAAYHIVNSKAFDYSVICSTEQAVVADRPIADELARRMEREGAVFVDAEQAAALGRALFHPDGAINPRSVGKSPQALAELADIRVPAHARILVARLSRVGPDEPLSREKLTTVLAFYESDGWEAGCDRSIELLKFGGDGHTLVIHCRDENVIVRFALEKPAFRIVVNQPGTLGAIGYTSGLDPAMTLATGGIGGGISSDNISVRHLLNVKRLAYPLIEWNWRSPAVSTALAAGLPAAVPAAGAGPATLAAALRAGPPSREEIDALVRRLLADDNR